jgi:uncharacterized protein (DUF885 family)
MIDARRAREILESRGRKGDAERLHELFRGSWDYLMAEYPEFATYVGHPGHDHRWTDMSLEAIERRNRELEHPAAVLRTIDRQALTPPDQLNFDLFQRGVDEALEGRRFKGEYMPVSQMGGVQQDLARVIAFTRPRTVADYEAVVARLRGIPTVLEQTIVLMEKGLEAGLTPPRITLRDVPQQIGNQIVEDPRASPFLLHFQQLPEAIPVGEQERLRGEAQDAYRSAVAPGFRRLHGYFRETYLPRTRETIAFTALPDGEAWYAFKVRQSTTTRLTPSEIHEIGLAEVKRIRGEMESVIAESRFEGGFEAFVGFLRTDPRFFFESPQDLLMAYRDIAKRADPELTKLFGTLPRLPYGVVPVPSYAEKSQTTAYYEPGSPAAGRPGQFFANTYDLKARPKWEMEALTLHEAVPGHHLQIALSQELTDVPEFRKHALEYTAYVEGWGLYSESLGSRMGFYKDPYSRFGQLTYEIWRAIRLVVDTGMHALGWSRQQALDYFADNAGKAEHDITVEVDRYIVWPGQALAYKIGELKIRELRDRATRELGERFDIRAFHDQVLGSGALPLDLLESRILAWIASAKGAA